jgi:hypothetical protein
LSPSAFKSIVLEVKFTLGNNKPWLALTISNLALAFGLFVPKPNWALEELAMNTKIDNEINLNFIFVNLL